MNKTTLSFTLDDTFNDRVVKFQTTLDGEGIESYYEAFEAFLLAVGFAQESISRRYEP